MKTFDLDVTLHIRAYDIEADSAEAALSVALELGEFEILCKEINMFWENEEDD